MTRTPTRTPTVAPTLICNQDATLRSILIRVIINSVSNLSVVSTVGTPQNEATTWIINKDAKHLCPNDPTLKRRYALAVFYYSTRGDRWLECSAPSNLTNPASVVAANANCSIQTFPTSGSDAWLTPNSECQWGGIACDDFGEVVALDLGTCGTAHSSKKFSQAGR